MTERYCEGERFTGLSFAGEAFESCDFADCVFADCSFTKCRLGHTTLNDGRRKRTSARVGEHALWKSPGLKNESLRAGQDCFAEEN